MSSTTFSPANNHFKLFHGIDRLLYGHLTLTLKLGAKESALFIAFWLWLEREVVDKSNLVSRLLDSPPSLVQKIVQDTALCLQCVESSDFPFPEPTAAEPDHVRAFVCKNITFRYLYDNREPALKGISSILTGVCIRAMEDLIVATAPVVEPPVTRPFNRAVSRPAGAPKPFNKAVSRPKARAHTAATPLNTHGISGGGWFELFPAPGWKPAVVEWVPFQLPPQRNYNVEDRSVILTFSGNAISEREIREYFYCTFGDVVESVTMHSVQAEGCEHLTHAALMARTSRAANFLVAYGSYAINGNPCIAGKLFP